DRVAAVSYWLVRTYCRSALPNDSHMTARIDSTAARATSPKKPRLTWSRGFPKRRIDPIESDDRFQCHQLSYGIADGVQRRPAGQAVVTRAAVDRQVVGKGQTAAEINRVVARAEIGE